MHTSPAFSVNVGEAKSSKSKHFVVTLDSQNDNLFFNDIYSDFLIAIDIEIDL